MSAIQRAALIVALIFLPCCGGLGGIAVIGAAVDPPPAAQRAADLETFAPAPAKTTTPTPAGTEPTQGATPTRSATPSPSATGEAPIVVKRTVKETRAVPFKTRTVRDSSLPEGTRKVRVKGARGERTLTYEISTTDGVQGGKKLLRSEITKAPVTRVIVVGTKSEPECDSNYSGCVPVASDVDCAGGSGNGPEYVSGVVRVIGSDIYDLDRDNDGYGCD